MLCNYEVYEIDYPHEVEQCIHGVRYNADVSFRAREKLIDRIARGRERVFFQMSPERAYPKFLYAA